MKVNKPKIRIMDNKTFFECLEDNEICNCEINGNVGNLVLNDFTIDSCIIRNVDFHNIELNNVNLLDVIFENCDLSNTNFNIFC